MTGIDATLYEFALHKVPRIHALNFLLHETLGGGGMASLRVDPLAKGFAQMLLDFPVAVWLDRYQLGS